MDLNHVAIFVRVVEAKSFTAAAAVLDLPKSSVSRSVAALEQELGVQLLARTTRKLALTDAGRSYYERARAALAALDEATAVATEDAKAPRGIVRVTAPPDAGALIAPLLVDFARQHPDVQVELSLSSRVVDLVDEGFDFAVRASRKLDDSALLSRKLGVTEIGLFASSAYLSARGRPQRVAELARHECVLFRARGGRDTWTLDGPSGPESVEVHGALAADDLGFVRSAIVAGAGIGFVPTYLCRSVAGGEPLERVLPRQGVVSGGLYVVWSASRHERAVARLLREHLVEGLSAQL